MHYVCYNSLTVTGPADQVTALIARAGTVGEHDKCRPGAAPGSRDRQLLSFQRLVPTDNPTARHAAWGTQSEPSQVERWVTDVADGAIQVSWEFHTPRSEPDGVLHAVAAEFPELHLAHTSQDERGLASRVFIIEPDPYAGDWDEDAGRGPYRRAEELSRVFPGIVNYRAPHPAAGPLADVLAAVELVQTADVETNVVVVADPGAHPTPADLAAGWEQDPPEGTYTFLRLNAAKHMAYRVRRHGCAEVEDWFVRAGRDWSGEPEFAEVAHHLAAGSETWSAEETVNAVAYLVSYACNLDVLAPERSPEQWAAQALGLAPREMVVSVLRRAQPDDLSTDVKMDALLAVLDNRPG